jgi:hypothetical protein
MTTQELLVKYKSEIESIVLFAKRINFDIENEPIELLLKAWLNDTLVLFRDENKEELLRIFKQLV